MNNVMTQINLKQKVISILISFLLVLKDDNIIKWFMFGLANLAFLFTFECMIDLKLDHYNHSGN